MSLSVIQTGVAFQQTGEGIFISRGPLRSIGVVSEHLTYKYKVTDRSHFPV